MTVPAAGVRVCNRYVLGEHIGSGGHGDIWSAIDEHDGQQVALKFLREDLAASAEAWAILNHESQMARRLNHPGILRTGTPMREGERTVLPMEFAGGGDLKRLRGQSYLRSVPVLIRIAEILAHAHARGVVHRDLKPGNVLFDAQGGVRLADFGAAGLSGSTHSHAQGSPFTASPQQLRDLPAAPADDIYGLGALAYELLTGYPPFYPNATVERVLHEPVPPLQPAQPAPARLCGLVMRMLEKDPAQRPATMQQVVEGLNQALADTLIVDDTEPERAVTAPPAELDEIRADRRVMRENRLLPLAAWMGGVGVVAAVLVALWVLKPWRGGVVEPAPAPALTAATPTVETAPEVAVAEPPAVAAPGDAPVDAAGDAPVDGPVAAPADTAPAAPVSPREVREAERLVQRGTEALGLQRYTDARSAFQRALQIEPGLPAATRGLEQVEAALASDGYAGVRHEGAALEAQERWREAADLYAEALGHDPSLAFAQAGQRRARERAELSDRLDGYLEQASRLSSPDVRAEARRWIDHARTLDDGPVLRSQVARVELLLKDHE